MPDNAIITSITVMPTENVVHVKARISRDNPDELTIPAVDVEQSFTFADLASVNATQDDVTLDGRAFVRGAKKSCQKALRQFYNNQPGAIANAINALDPNG